MANLFRCGGGSPFTCSFGGISSSDGSGTFQIVCFADLDVSKIKKITVLSPDSVTFHGTTKADGVTIAKPTLPFNVSNYSVVSFNLIARPSAQIRLKFE